MDRGDRGASSNITVPLSFSNLSGSKSKLHKIYLSIKIFRFLIKCMLLIYVNVVVESDSDDDFPVDKIDSSEEESDDHDCSRNMQTSCMNKSDFKMPINKSTYG